MTEPCVDCGGPIADRLVKRRTKRFCDACLREHRLERQRQRDNPHSSGVCPDCGSKTSQPGRRCDPCGRRVAGQRKSQTAERKREAQRRTALVLLREWGHRHGGVGPTMASWNELGYVVTAHQVLTAFGGWLRAIEAAGLESADDRPQGRGTMRHDRGRQMVTGGWKGGKAPRGDAPVMDRSMSYV